VAPQAANPAQPARPAQKPHPPKKRSVIHYPTPEEAEREAEEMTAQSGTGERKERSWMTRALTGLFRR
jgi:hypothetical protein